MHVLAAFLFFTPRGRNDSSGRPYVLQQMFLRATALCYSETLFKVTTWHLASSSRMF